MITLTSQKNYMKHFAFESASMAKPATLNADFNYESSFVVTHNLGYIPLVRAYYDQNASGVILPCTGQQGVQTAFGPTVNFWFWVDNITTTTVTFKCEDFFSHSGVFTFYYKIYYDFET